MKFGEGFCEGLDLLASATTDPAKFVPGENVPLALESASEMLGSFGENDPFLSWDRFNEFQV